MDRHTQHHPASRGCSVSPGVKTCADRLGQAVSLFGPRKSHVGSSSGGRPGNELLMTVTCAPVSTLARTEQPLMLTSTKCALSVLFIDSRTAPKEVSFSPWVNSSSFVASRFFTPHVVTKCPLQCQNRQVAFLAGHSKRTRNTRPQYPHDLCLVTGFRLGLWLACFAFLLLLTSPTATGCACSCSSLCYFFSVFLVVALATAIAEIRFGSI